MSNDTEKYAVFSIRGLPAGVWGESYAIVTAFESAPKELTSEYFVLTKRPKEALHQDTLRIVVSPLPPELGTIDIDFALQEGVHRTETLLMDGLDARAVELSRPDVAHLQFELKSTNTGDLLSCWMRGLFNSQITEVQRTTQCRSLARYLGLMSQVSITTRAG